MLHWLQQRNDAMKDVAVAPSRRQTRAQTLAMAQAKAAAQAAAIAPATTASLPGNNRPTIWLDVIHKHFEANSLEMSKTVANWASSAGRSSSLRKTYTELTSALAAGGYQH